jgi:hypothetical protein
VSLTSRSSMIQTRRLRLTSRSMNSNSPHDAEIQRR